MKPIQDIVAKLDVPPAAVHPYGSFAAKIDPAVVRTGAPRASAPKLVLVSAITPTPAGEGKTTTTIGLGDALTNAGESVCIALREPSLGPCFGMKGGGTGGGRAQVVPSDRVNLHFTGDFHAVTAAHNLLAALIDSHLHFQNELRIEARTVKWPRVLDVNDRSLRDVVIGLGGRTHGIPRETRFEITAASELMAMLCLAEDEADMRARIGRTLIALDRDRAPVTVGDLGATGAMLALLGDALMPNLVQTLEGTPAFVHGGPFANIAHGCNSVSATKTALHLAEWVVTEAGFGFDLGAEKFFNIKCRASGLATAAVVLVASARALKMHGGRAVGELDEPDVDAVRLGLSNLHKHVESIRLFGQEPIVALNRRATDTDEEIEVVRAACESRGLPFAVADHFAHGGAGAAELARVVQASAVPDAAPPDFLYGLDEPVSRKVCKVAQAMYGARDVAFTRGAERDLREILRLGLAHLPICIAKTPSSLSDDPALRGRPRDFEVTVRGVEANAGAGFLVVLTGDILRMPGLPARPNAFGIDLVDGEVTGLV